MFYKGSDIKIVSGIVKGNSLFDRCVWVLVCVMYVEKKSIFGFGIFLVYVIYNYFSICNFVLFLVIIERS